jgi:hypothetical protein
MIRCARTITIAMFLSSCLFAFCVSALGQARARVSGLVKDEAGSVVVEARVRLRNVETNFTLSTVTDALGQYNFANVPPGKYELRIEAPGFSTFAATLELTVGQYATVDATLKVATIAETITVTAEVPTIEPTKTEVSQVVEGRRITDLPISGRQFIDFTLLTPTVVIGKALSSGAQGPIYENVTKISFAGLSEQHSNFFALDGADHNISLSGYQRLMPSQEAVQEFRILTGMHNAEFGRALGGIVNIITKSGTNEWHGSLYHFFRNDALDARTVLTPRGFETFRLNQFGFTAGGPIVKDKTFAFGNYEGQRKAQAPVYTQFLLDNLPAINAVKAYYRLSPEVLEVLRRENYDQFLIRVDHQLTEGNRMMMRHNFVDQRNKNARGAPGNLGAPSTFRDNPVRDQSFVFNLLSLPSSKITNEILFQYARRSFAYESVSGEPNFEVANVLMLGKAIGPVDRYRETRLQFSDTVGYQRGRHGFKFGWDFNHIRDRVVWPLAPHGYLVFSPESFFGAPPFGRPTPFLFVFTVPTVFRDRPLVRSTDWRRVIFPTPEFEEVARIAYTHNTLDVFAQDQWRASEKLTVNYGLRYFVETPGPFDMEKDLNNFQPRLGLAYTFDRRSVLRAGFGVFHGVLSFANTFVATESCIGGGRTNLSLLLGPMAAESYKRPDPPCVGLAPIPSPEFTAPVAFAFLTQGVYPTGAGIPLIINSFNHDVRDFPNPYAMHWNLQIEREVMSDLSVSVGYLGVRALKMVTYRQLNFQPIGRLPNGKTRYAPRDLRFGIYHEEFPGNASIYHGGMVTVSRRFRNNFAVTANYTFSKTIDLVQSGSTISFKDGPEDPGNLRLNRGLSNQHVGQRFVLSFLAEAPSRGFLRNFKISSIITLESPRFYTVFAGFDVNGDLEIGTDRVGTIGRNTYRGDSFRNFDVRVSRIVNFTERVSGEFLVEFFNLFNTVNVIDVNTVYGAADFIGSIPREFGDGVPAPIPTFGTPADVATARQIQFAFKLRF